MTSVSPGVTGGTMMVVVVVPAMVVSMSVAVVLALVAEAVVVAAVALPVVLLVSLQLVIVSVATVTTSIVAEVSDMVHPAVTTAVSGIVVAGKVAAVGQIDSVVVVAGPCLSILLAIVPLNCESSM